MQASQKRDTLDRLAKVGPKAAAAGRGDGGASGALLSVGSVAELLGAPKAQIKRALMSEQFAGRLSSKRPGASEESGRAVLVPRTMLDEVRDAVAALSFDAEPALSVPESTADSAAEGARQSGPDMPLPVEEPATPQQRVDEPQPTAPPPMPLSVVYERLLAEKDARIWDLRSEIEHLRSVLEREQAGHARAQALLSMQAPPPSTEYSPEFEARDSKASDEPSADSPPRASAPEGFPAADSTLPPTEQASADQVESAPRAPVADPAAPVGIAGFAYAAAPTLAPPSAGRTAPEPPSANLETAMSTPEPAALEAAHQPTDFNGASVAPINSAAQTMRKRPFWKFWG